MSKTINRSRLAQTVKVYTKLEACTIQVHSLQGCVEAYHHRNEQDMDAGEGDKEYFFEKEKMFFQEFFSDSNKLNGFLLF